jgi:hypothetical protein
VQAASQVAERVERESWQAASSATQEAKDQRATYIKDSIIPTILNVALSLNPWIHGTGDDAWISTANEVNTQLKTMERPISARKLRERVTELLQDFKKREMMGNRSGHEPVASKHDATLSQIQELIAFNKQSLSTASAQSASKKVRSLVSSLSLGLF